MKKLLLLALLASGLLAGTAQAAPMFSTNSENTCQLLARMATFFAQYREKAVPIEEARQVVFNSSTKNQNLISDVLYVIEIVYTYPLLPASEEGNVIYNLCRDETPI